MDQQGKIVVDEHIIKTAALLSSLTIDEIEQMLETDIFELMGIKEALSEEQRDVILESFLDIVRNRVVGQIFNLLSDEDRKQFDQLIDQDKLDEADRFLVEKKINKDQLVLKEIVMLKLEFMNKEG